MEHAFNDLTGKNVVGLTDEECKGILSHDSPHLTGYLLDYYNGKPIKLDFERRPNGNIWVSAIGYDVSNGRYRFLEALLFVFNLEEIVITEMEYPPQSDGLLDCNTVIPDEEIALLENILKHTFMYTDNGIYWKIDTSAVDYKPLFIREL